MQCCLCLAASGTCSASVALLWAHLLCNSEAHWAIIFPCSFKKDAKLCLLSWNEKKKLWNNLTKISHDSEHIMVHHTQFSFPASFLLIDRKIKSFFVLDFVTHNLNSYESLLGSRNLNESFFSSPEWGCVKFLILY